MRYLDTVGDRVADRPHAVTIALSLFAAGITGIGVYLNYARDVPVPRVLRMNRREALRVIRDARLKGKVIPESPSDAAVVSQQSPSAGQLVRPDTEIDLFFETANPSVILPPTEPHPGPNNTGTRKEKPSQTTGPVSQVIVLHPYDLQGASFQVDGHPAVVIKSDLRSTILELSPGNHRLTAVNSGNRCDAIFQTPESRAVPMKCSPYHLENAREQ